MVVPVKTVLDFRVTEVGHSFPDSHSKILALANGQFDIGWSQDRTSVAFWDTDVRIMRLNADGTLALSRGAVPIAPADTAESDASLATLGGYQVVAYTDRGSPGTPGSILLNFYDKAALEQGNFVTKSVEVASWDSFDPTVAALTNGSLAVVYMDKGAKAVMARVYDPETDTFNGPAVTVSTTPSLRSGDDLAPDIGIQPLADGRFAVTWNDDFGSGRLRILDGDGGLVSGDLYRVSGVSASAVTELTGGELAVAWHIGGHVMIQLFDVAGASPVLLSSTIVGTGPPPGLAITALNDGRAMVVWIEGGQVMGSIMDVDGTHEAAFVVTGGADPLLRPDIETLADGRVVVSYEKGGTDPGIFAAVLDPREAGIDLAGTADADQYVGTSFDDEFALGDGNDHVVAGAGDDRIDGGQGADIMLGGAGNDAYFVDNAGDVVDESAVGSNGIDTVNTTITVSLLDAARFKGGIENVTLLGAASISAIGNALANLLIGNAGSNVLDGGAGADMMRGLAGNDVYGYRDAGDVVDESVAGSGGIDTVNTLLSVNLADNVHFKGAIENVVLFGTADINATGNGLANVLTGNSGANVLDGGAGADLMRGMGGNDTYGYRDAGDVVDESVAGSGGIDTVNTTLSINLADAAHFKGDIENVRLFGTANLDATGNALANVLIGNSGNNVLNGGGGADTLAGGAGNDNFAFTTALGAGNIDRITDFGVSAGNDDRILLDHAIFTTLVAGSLSADAFTANTDGVALDASDRIVYETDTGKLFYDANGNAAGGLIQFAVLDGAPLLTAIDFFVI